MKILTDLIAEQINFLDERFYGLGDNFYPSTTTVLEAYPKGYRFQQWLKDLGSNADQVLERAAQTGTKVHDAIHRLLLGEELEWDSSIYGLDEWQYIIKFMEFWEEYKPMLIATEMSMVNPKLGYGGTLDLIVKFREETWLIDLKTSNAIHSSYELQVAAYRALYEDFDTYIVLPDGSVDQLDFSNPIKVPKVDRAGIFWFKSKTRGADKLGKKIQGKGWCLEEFQRPHEESFALFESVHKIWLNENPDSKPKNKVLPTRLKLNVT